MRTLTGIQAYIFRVCIYKHVCCCCRVCVCVCVRTTTTTSAHTKKVYSCPHFRSPADKSRQLDYHVRLLYTWKHSSISRHVEREHSQDDRPQTIISLCVLCVHTFSHLIIHVRTCRVRAHERFALCAVDFQNSVARTIIIVLQPKYASPTR